MTAADAIRAGLARGYRPRWRLTPTGARVELGPVVGEGPDLDTAMQAALDRFDRQVGA